MILREFFSLNIIKLQLRRTKIILELFFFKDVADVRSLSTLTQLITQILLLSTFLRLSFLILIILRLFNSNVYDDPS